MSTVERLDRRNFILVCIAEFCLAHAISIIEPLLRARVITDIIGVFTFISWMIF